MSDASLLTNESRFNGLFIGGSGCGKKVAACTFPHPIKYLDFDNRIRGILGASWIERKGIDYKYYPPCKGPGQKLMYEEINADCDAMMTQAFLNQFPYKTVIIASLTGEFYGLLKDATTLTHNIGAKGEKKSGRYVGTMAIPDPGDYPFVYNGLRNILAFFRSLPGVNVIVMGHTVPRYAKPIKESGEVDNYADAVQVGTRLSLTDKAASELPSGFDNIFEFSKAFDGNKEHFYVQFRSDMARTTYAKLPNGQIEITGRNFYEYFKQYSDDTLSIATDTSAAVQS